MHNNYFIFKPLGEQLTQLLRGGVIVECYSQDKDEIIFGILNGAQEFYIHALLRSDLSLLRFPAQLQRARKNTVDLFPELLELKIEEVFCYRHERCLGFKMSNSFLLLFKMFEGKSNIILCHNQKPAALFKKKLKEDLDLVPELLHQPLDLSKEHFWHLQGDLRTFMPTLGAPLRSHLQSKGYENKSREEQWELLVEVLKQLENPIVYLSRSNGLPVLRLYDEGNYYYKTADLIEGLNTFYIDYITRQTLLREKKAAIRPLRATLKRTNAYLKRLHTRKRQLTDQVPLQVLGDMIMAYMHKIPEGATSIDLPHFDTNEVITIPLKSQLTPQKNAERYYRKSKNQKKERKVLKANLQQKSAELEVVNDHLSFLEDCDSLKELRAYIKEHGLIKKTQQPQTEDLFKVFHCQGFSILVGKNAANNDLLTQRHAHKDDLWMHAKDVKGSHVVVKHQAGRPIPEPVIERAAQLAAYYSKRKQDNLCPVAYTPKKHVRKPKGAAPGQVVVEKEKVILVEPKP